MTLLILCTYAKSLYNWLNLRIPIRSIAMKQDVHQFGIPLKINLSVSLSTDESSFNHVPEGPIEQTLNQNSSE